jgi:hypothetical protein
MILAKMRLMLITQTRFFFRVHLSSLKYQGKANGINTVVINPAKAPEVVIYAANIM